MSQRVLIIGKVWPEPASSAAGSRMMQLLDVFKEQGHELCFVSASGASEFAVELEEQGIATRSILLNDSSFDDFVRQHDPHLVVFDRFTSEEQFGWRVAQCCPNALRVLDTEDLHCLRYARQEAFKAGRELTEKDLLNDFSKREIASIYRCDLSLIISEYEMRLLQEVFKVDPALLFYLPFLVAAPTDLDLAAFPGFEERRHFISIGNFLHEPNWDAVLHLKKNIWPLIRQQLPKAELHVYGAYATQKVFELDHKKEGFLIKGRAADVKEVMQKARVCLAPLRFGAGLKGKLADAMLNGTPSVTSSIGAEGMQGDLAWPGEIADQDKTFAAAAVEHYTSADKWKTAQVNGRKLLQQRFEPSAFKTHFKTQLKELQEHLEEHRQQNFTGAMLMHHQLSSLRYMALWIEEKNKNKTSTP